MINNKFDELDYNQLTDDEKLEIFVHGQTDDLGAMGLVTHDVHLSEKGTNLYRQLGADGFSPSFARILLKTMELREQGAFGEFDMVPMF